MCCNIVAFIVHAAVMTYSFWYCLIYLIYELSDASFSILLFFSLTRVSKKNSLSSVVKGEKASICSV